MLKIGWSKREIGMDGPVGIVGQFHLRISKGVFDSLYTTALVISDESNITIMVSADITSPSDNIILDIRNAVRERNPEIPAEKILLSATHTHNAGMFQHNSGYHRAPLEGVDIIPAEIYRKFFVSKVCDAVCEAYENRSEGSYAYGYDYAVVAHHRRPTYTVDVGARDNDVKSSLMTDKYARMYGETNDPAFDGYEGNVDSSVYFLFTFDKDEKLTGAIINVPCPSQNCEMEEFLTADYWAQVRDIAKERYGDIYILPQCACAGDMAPRTLHAKDAERRKQSLKFNDKTFDGMLRPWEMYNRFEIAERIMHAFDSVYSWASKDIIKDSKIYHEVKMIPLDTWKITKAQYEESVTELAHYKKQGFVKTDDPAEDFYNNTRMSSVHGRYESIIARYLDGSDNKDVEVHIIRIGDIAFASNPFELYINFQHKVQARSPFIQTFMVQLAASINGVAGYLCTERAAENMGYSAIIHSCQISPKGGDTLVEETLKELERLHSK